MSQALATYNRTNLALCQATALKQQKANRSDPFTYNRVMTHLLNGLCLISDYNVQFRKEPRKTAQGASYSVDISWDMKRP